MYYYSKDDNGRITAYTQSPKVIMALDVKVYTTESEIVDYYGGARIKSELTAEQLTAWARYQQLEAEQAQVEADWQAFLKTPVVYTNGKSYLPAWVFDTYPAVLMGFSAGLFNETQIGDASELASNVVTMDQTQFVGLCTFLQSKWQYGYAQKCQRLEAIDTEKKQLELVL